MVNLVALITFNNGYVYYIGQSNKISITMDSLRTKNLGKIPWGIESNIANIKFKDLQGNFKSYIKNETVYNAKVEIYFSDSTDNYNQNELIGTFFVKTVEYSDNTSTVEITLNDGLEAWQSIEIPAIYKYNAGNLYDIVIDAIGDANYQNFFVPFDTYEAKNILTGISLNSGINWEKSNLWNIMQKVCEASRCCLYTNEKGKAVIERPNGKRIVVVNPKNIYGITEQKSNFETKISNAYITIEKRLDHYAEPISSPISIVFYKELPQMLESSLPEFNFATEKGCFVGDSTTYNPQLSGTTKSGTIVLGDSYLRTINISAICELNKFSNRNVEKMFGELKTSTILNYKMDLETKQFTYDESERIEELTIKGYDIYRKKIDLESIDVGLFSLTSNTLSTYFHKSGSLTIIGDYYESDGTETFSYNEGATANTVQLPSNDLILNTTTEGQTQLAKNNLNYVKQKYLKGIETVVLKCSLDNYYDTSNNQIIYKNTIGKRSFQKYDIVLPYKIKNGKKVPYSSYPNGRAKLFQVVGIKFENYGVLWQYLYLEEYVSN